jgi:hypothetical protein
LAVRPPRDWSRIKDRIVGFMLGLNSFNTIEMRKDGVRLVPSVTFVWFFFCMFLSYGVFAVLGVKDYSQMEKYSSWWIILTILFFLMPQIVFRGILHYEDIPRGWGYHQWKFWLKHSKEDVISRNRRWVLLGIAVLILIGLIHMAVSKDPFGIIDIIGVIVIIMIMIGGYRKYQAWRDRSRSGGN